MFTGGASEGSVAEGSGKGSWSALKMKIAGKTLPLPYVSTAFRG